MKGFWATIGLFVLVSCQSAQREKPVAASTEAPGVQRPAMLFSSLDMLALPNSGRAMHEGSWARDGGNGDARRVEPGQTLTLMDYKGAGVVHRFWVTIAPRADMKIHAQAILRMYWDGETEPSVEAPVGAFFGVGFGQQKDFTSLPLNEMSGGYNCYWPMPFHKSAKWTITNMSDKAIDAFYYNVDFTAYDSLPANVRHFHAQWHRENPTDPAHNYTILEATGDGQFCGVALFMQARKPRDIGFLEGDEVIYIDQPEALRMIHPDHRDAASQSSELKKPKPQIIGTGTEDYFSSGWYFDHGPYSAPYHGCIIKDELMARVSAYRWHIEDAMPFHQCIRVSIEHGTNNDHEADYSSVAYWYQTEPHKAFSMIPADAKDLLPYTPPAPMSYKGAIEAEKLTPVVSNGEAHVQQMGMFMAGGGEWSGEAQLFWTGAGVGDSMTLEVPSPDEGDYRISAWFTTAPDYGMVQPMMGTKALGKPIDLYTPSVKSTARLQLGDEAVHLKKGSNAITFKITGKNASATNTFVGIDAFMLRKVKPPTSFPTSASQPGR